MPEINPYESPQSEPLPSAEEQLPDEPFPAWLGRALWTQFAAIVVTWVCAALLEPLRQSVWDMIVLCLLGMTALLSLFNLIAAIRYRIGWLVVLELIVIGLPLMLLFTVELQ